MSHLGRNIFADVLWYAVELEELPLIRLIG